MSNLMPGWKEVAEAFREMDTYGSEYDIADAREWVNFINRTDMGDVVVGATFDSIEVKENGS